MFQSLTYISKIKWPSEGRDGWLQQLAGKASLDNGRFSTTGCLVATDRYFVQTLEGAPSSIDQLMKNIQSDERHSELIVISSKQSDPRRYPSWTMKFLGFNYYLNAHIERLLFFDDSQILSFHKPQLLQFMVEISRIADQQLEADRSLEGEIDLGSNSPIPVAKQPCLTLRPIPRISRASLGSGDASA